jgi:hypothetical protein
MAWFIQDRSTCRKVKTGVDDDGAEMIRGLELAAANESSSQEWSRRVETNTDENNHGEN